MKRLFTLVFIFLSLQLFSQNTWTGNVNNRWNNAGNWSYGYIPVATEDAEINSNAKVIIPNGVNAQCKNLYMGVWQSSSLDTLIIRPGAQLNAHAIYFETIFNEGRVILGNNMSSSSYGYGNSFTNDGYVEIDKINGILTIGTSDSMVNNDTIIAPKIWTSGSMTNNHFIEVNPTQNNTGSSFDGGIVVRVNNFGTAGDFTNNGEIVKKGIEMFMEIEQSATFTNESTGIITVTTPTSFSNEYEIECDGLFSNKGTINLNNSNINGKNGIRLFQGTAVFENRASGSINLGSRDGTPIYLESNANFNNLGYLNLGESTSGDLISGVAFFDNDGGTLEGNGTISITNFTNNGLLSPGQSPGKITRTGNLNLGSSAYKCEIGGTAGAGVTGGNDLLEITDNLNLGGGQLNVLLIDGFVPSIGDQFVIVTAGTTLTNTFGTINYPALPAGFWEITYNTNNVTLSVVLNPLPIELSQFTVEKNENRHDLKWTTASEQNSSHFEIEYSADGIDWENIGVVQAIGESNIENHYSYSNFSTDRFMEVHYYRLKMVDLDESFEYSPIQSISDNTFSDVRIFPNPTQDLINIYGLEEGVYQLFNHQGQLIQSNTFEGNTTLSLSELLTGIYHLKVIADGETFSDKILLHKF